jgi:hypothetical protein
MNRDPLIFLSLRENPFLRFSLPSPHPSIIQAQVKTGLNAKFIQEYSGSKGKTIKRTLGIQLALW